MKRLLRSCALGFVLLIGTGVVQLVQAQTIILRPNPMTADSTAESNELFGQYLQTRVEDLGFTPADSLPEVPSNYSGLAFFLELTWSVMELGEGKYAVAVVRNLVLIQGQETPYRATSSFTHHSYGGSDLRDAARQVAEVSFDEYQRVTSSADSLLSSDGGS